MKTYQPITAEIIEKLKAITGPTYVKTDKDLLLQYQTDYETNPAMFHLPEAAVSPANAQEISDIVKLANEYDFPITVRSGGTSLADGAIPVCGGLVLCMDRLNKIIELNEEGMYMTVEAGVRTVDLQNAAKKVGLMYAGDPSSAESCLIGGNLATNAGGLRAVRYGVTRDQVYCLEIVTPTGISSNAAASSRNALPATTWNSSSSAVKGRWASSPKSQSSSSPCRRTASTSWPSTRTRARPCTWCRS